MAEKTISITLRVWRQDGPQAEGRFASYHAKDIPADLSFL